MTSRPLLQQRQTKALHLTAYSFARSSLRSLRFRRRVRYCVGKGWQVKYFVATVDRRVGDSWAHCKQSLSPLIAVRSIPPLAHEAEPSGRAGGSADHNTIKMATRDRWAEMEAKYEAVDKETRQSHLAGFVTSFVVSAKRDRWITILLNKPSKAQRDGHNIVSDLIRTRCFSSDNRALRESNEKGVYYEFSHKALWLPVQDALSVGQQSDAIFSLKEGKLAVFFNHEFSLFREWVCEN